MSLFALSIALALSVVLMESGAPSLARAILFFPFFIAAFGAYQGLFRTCSFAARQGVRLADHGEEMVTSRQERDRMRREGRKVFLGSLATAVAATLAVVILP